MNPVQVASLSVKLCGIYVWTQVAYLLAFPWSFGTSMDPSREGMVTLALFAAVGAALFFGADRMAPWMVRGASAEPTSNDGAEVKREIAYSVAGLAIVLSSLGRIPQIAYYQPSGPQRESSGMEWEQGAALLAFAALLVGGLYLFFRGGKALAASRKSGGGLGQPGGNPNQVVAFSVVGLFFLVMGLSAMAGTFGYHSTMTDGEVTSAGWLWDWAPLLPGGLKAVLGGIVFYCSTALADLWHRFQRGTSPPREA